MKKRLNITLDVQIYEYLQQLCERRNTIGKSAMITMLITQQQVMDTMIQNVPTSELKEMVKALGGLEDDL